MNKDHRLIKRQSEISDDWNKKSCKNVKHANSNANYQVYHLSYVYKVKLFNMCIMYNIW